MQTRPNELALQLTCLAPNPLGPQPKSGRAPQNSNTETATLRELAKPAKGFLQSAHIHARANSIISGLINYAFKASPRSSVLMSARTHKTHISHKELWQSCFSKVCKICWNLVELLVYTLCKVCIGRRVVFSRSCDIP